MRFCSLYDRKEWQEPRTGESGFGRSHRGRPTTKLREECRDISLHCITGRGLQNRIGRPESIWLRIISITLVKEESRNSYSKADLALKERRE